MKKRKRPDIAERKHKRRAVGQETFVVKTGFARFCRDPLIARGIEQALRPVTQMCFEASRLVNLHVLRLLEQQRLPLPAIDQTMIDHAFALVTAEAKSFKAKQTDDLLALEETFRNFYQPQRAQHFIPATRSGLTRFRQSARKDYLTNCQNHVAVNFYSRHCRFLRWLINQHCASFVAAKGKDKRRIVAWMYRATTVSYDERPSIDELTNLLSVPDQQWCQAIVIGIRRDISGGCADRFPVTKTQLARHWHQYLPWLFIVQRVFEANGKRTFSLLPIHSANAKFLTIDTATLHALYSAALPKETGSKPNRKSFFETKEQWWRRAFHLDRVVVTNKGKRRILPTHGPEKQRQFEYFLRTDGL
ncbi:MAG TPA: hypothetical protein VFA15_09300, partial [Nitrososphaera sp.]|nr:hypothetical protein [Nitrososphaera sp.]